MKKCRQCGILSADTATVCRNCNAKFTEEDKPIVAKKAKKKSGIFTVISVVVAVIIISAFALYQSGMLKTWFESSEKKDIATIAEEFVLADFEKDAQTIKEYMFDEYVMYHTRQGTFSLEDDGYVSFYFSAYNPDTSIDILSIKSEILDENYDIYASVISSKYAVVPNEIASVYVEVQITDGEFTQSTIAPLTFVTLENNWYVVPVL